MKGVALVELWVQACYAFGHNLWPRPAVTLVLQTRTVNSVGYEVIHHALGASVAEFQIEFVTTHAVSVRSHLNRDVWIVVHHLNHRVECSFRLWSQGCLIVVVEDVVDYLRLGHGCENEVDIVLSIGFLDVAGELLLAVEVAISTSEHHIAYSTLQVKTERTVGLSYSLLVAAVVTHDADDCIWHWFLVFVEYIARYPDFEVWFFKAEDVVITSRILAVAGEVSLFALLYDLIYLYRYD